MSPPSRPVKRFLYIFTNAPYSTAIGQEGLDAVLVAAAFELRVSVLFLHDGVFQLKSGQGAGVTKIKQFTKAFPALGDFGVGETYVLDSSLTARGLEPEQLTMVVEVLDQQAVTSLIKEQDRVFTF